jgi:hypothetical protein
MFLLFLELAVASNIADLRRLRRRNEHRRHRCRARQMVSRRDAICTFMCRIPRMFTFRMNIRIGAA